MLDSFPVLRRVPVVDCVSGEKFRGTSELQRQTAELGLSNVRCWSAKLPVPYSCHHTKLILLTYDAGIRVVVFTANLLACDVYYKNQGIFVQDFPPKPSAPASTPADEGEERDRGEGWLRNDFERTLCEYFAQYRSCGLDVGELLRRFDYTAAKVVLLPSAPGTWQAREMSRWGHMKLRAVLQRS